MKVVALAGGVGGAKLVDGLAAAMPSEDLTVVVNTGDDFEHLGLSISPDLDTVMYTLAGLANPETGWGRADESWNFLETLGTLGGPTWFRLGDRDLALHAERTRRLRRGEKLSEITVDISKALGIQVRLLPMSDNPIRTMVHSDKGELTFQEYFVALACEPTVRSFEFAGADEAKPAPGVIEAIEQADVVIFCPSNPWVSLDPILALPNLRRILAASRAPKIGVSPLVGGEAENGDPVEKHQPDDVGDGFARTPHRHAVRQRIRGAWCQQRPGNRQRQPQHNIRRTAPLEDRVAIRV